MFKFTFLIRRRQIKLFFGDFSVHFTILFTIGKPGTHYIHGAKVLLSSIREKNQLGNEIK